MANYINEISLDKKMVNILISTIYDYKSIMLCVTRFSPERIFLLVDKNPDKNQKNAIDTIKNALGEVVEIKEKKISVYDIVEVSEKVVDIIDTLSNTDIIYVNTTAGRKTQSLGLIYGCYARIKNIKEMVYVTEEEHKIVYLPKLTLKINESQEEMLKLIEKNKLKSIMEISDNLKLSRAIVYRNFETLTEKGMIKQTDGGIELTDYGKLVLL